MLVVVARIHARADRAEDVEALLGPLAQASRRDPGCTSYGFFRDVEDATRFVSVETWDSRADLDAHMGFTHTTEALAQVPDLVAAPPTIHSYEVASTTQLA